MLHSMKIKITHTFLFLLLSANAIISANAGPHSHEAHEHGVAQLTLAIEGNVLAIEFESPAANLVGFEHKARTQEEIKQVKQAKDILNSPEALFSFIGTNCIAQKTTADVSGVKGDAHNEHKHHDHPKNHSEITANYLFNCKNSSQLTSLSIALFEKFNGIKIINATWITDTEQRAEKLNAEKKIIFLR